MTRWPERADIVPPAPDQIPQADKRERRYQHGTPGNHHNDTVYWDIEAVRYRITDLTNLMGHPVLLPTLRSRSGAPRRTALVLTDETGARLLPVPPEQALYIQFQRQPKPGCWINFNGDAFYAGRLFDIPSDRPEWLVFYVVLMGFNLAIGPPDACITHPEFHPKVCLSSKAG